MNTNFAATMGKTLSRIFGKLRRRDYLLMDGTNSCAYLPRHTYRRLQRLLERRLEEDPKAENSLRFLWVRMSPEGGYCLLVNMEGIDMCHTHGLAVDTAGRILVPCPYLQQVYGWLGVEPEWCGRVYLGDYGDGILRVLKGYTLLSKTEKKQKSCTD